MIPESRLRRVILTGGRSTYVMGVSTWLPVAFRLAHSGGVIFECDVLQGRIGMEGNRIDRVIGHTGANPNQRPQIHDRGKHDAIDGELLNLMEQGFPFSGIVFTGLFHR